MNRSKIIIGVHGLGNKPDQVTLTKWWRQAILEGLKSGGKYFTRPKIEMVYWADILNGEPLTEKVKDPDNPLFIEERYSKAPKNYERKSHPLRRKILDFIDKQLDKILLNDDLSINFSFITNKIIHKYFHELEVYYSEKQTESENSEHLVKDKIRQRLVRTLNKYRDHDILLIAHSMGSIIAYDVLTFILPEAKIDTFITIGSPLGMPIVRSKIAAEANIKLYGTQLKTPPGILNRWYNFSDLEDQVAMIYELKNDFLPNKLGVRVIDRVVDNNYFIRGKHNPHKSYGYLRTDEMINVIYDFWTKDRFGKSNLIERMVGESINNFKAISNSSYSEAKKKLRKIRRKLN
ncbi:MAG: GPI inositol-deacylase [Melioribacteraceae bacterium]|nr:GPI inositol-deacylase [Melioribacteraceae bacterium]MCF8264106.1 GPI inositol-deacylase [Melioribacteraceae bacterium]MCF8431487.1 GPI inositol-deacylase [Melioribacteraceae bacterium]